MKCRRFDLVELEIGAGSLFFSKNDLPAVIRTFRGMLLFAVLVVVVQIMCFGLGRRVFMLGCMDVFLPFGMGVCIRIVATDSDCRRQQTDDKCFFHCLMIC